MRPPVIVYHGNCSDGWCAAFVLKSAKGYSNASLVAAHYGVPLDVAALAGRNVVMVDYALPRAETQDLWASAASLRILDHHKTASDIADLSCATIDQSRSGAQLAWDFLHPATARPWFVDYVADRDLWQWKLPRSKAVNAYLWTVPHDIPSWRELWSHEFSPSRAADLGEGVMAGTDSYVRRMVAQARRCLWPADGVFPTDPIHAAQWLSAQALNVSYPYVSEVLDALLKDPDTALAVGWSEHPKDFVKFSLRSKPGVDVAALASAFPRGGGHATAAGFELSIPDSRVFLDQLLNRRA